MADGEVKIDTKLDTSGLDKGLKDMKNKLDGAGKTIDAGAKKGKGFADSLKGISTKAVVAAGAVAGVSVAVKKTVDALNDCEKAYQVQRKAEIALQTAAKNNPYLNDESVYNLRNFASELQSLSEIGDEVSLQVMSQLAATGRNEEQIMSIMSAAADMAAVTGNSIQNVALQLNKTYSGLAGELGEANGAIRALTKEELENGKAIEIVANQYKGAAQSTADVNVQLSNTWGDFKENIGRGWSKVTQPVKKFFLDVLSSINEVTAETNDLSDAAKNRGSSLSTAAQTKLLLDEQTKRLSEMQKMSALNDKIRADSSAFMKLSEQEQRRYTEFMAKTSTEEIRDEMARLTDEVRTLTVEYGKLSTAEKTAAEAAARAASEAEKKAAAEARNKAAAEYIAENTKAIEEQVAAMELRAEISGEEIDAGEMYNAYMQSYIDLITKSNGLVTENNQAAKERLAILTELAQKAKDAATAEERQAAAEALLKEADELVADYKNTDKAAAYKEQQEHLQEMRKAVLSEIAAENEDEVAFEKTKADRIKAIDEEMANNRRELLNSMGSEFNDYAQKTTQVLQDAANFALRVEKDRMTAELANLEIKYRKGELGEEEYQEKVAAAKKKGAKIQYQIEMAQWASNILAATANTAVGVTQALAQGGFPAGIIMGALVGAAGAVQLASIMAAKPIPHFAGGGFVGGMNGASMGADNTTIAARGGELMVNAAQQRELWDVLNGNAGSLGNVNLIVNNSASNLVSTRAQIDKNKIELMIDARVNDGLRNGRFNAGLNAANASMSGDFYGI